MILIYFYSQPGIGLDHLSIRNLRSAVSQPPKVTKEVLTEPEKMTLQPEQTTLQPEQPEQINEFLAEDVHELTRFTRQLSARLCQEI